ncbi:sulfurtransferase-like selenium metabolism protein YedF [Vagococcus elongatus]|uniref:Sulfurtransferase-like selenium metabolism protein YedF n=1 Tax=Vagococcus elongatus TaxID=180344 RepID=A0A430AMM6_9ENTE|nr:sulfurtransferase-like selenium metabolism protein YedF [Vagococcus elongatus]RSU09345.1 sulfurtransferase-like selenium metabolism protein YedF [Vagococcus elongatus]
MKKIEIDMLGQPCPLPVVAVKKALKDFSGETGEIIVQVDNQIAVDNVSKMVTQKGHRVSASETGNHFQLVVEVAGQEDSSTNARVVISIGHQVMGGGDDTLGAMLMKSYIYSLTELDNPPEKILFYNGGAHITCEGSQAIEDLKLLESSGTEILTCGACLDFYQLLDKLAVGQVTNMFNIAEAMEQADKVINL